MKDNSVMNTVMYVVNNKGAAVVGFGVKSYMFGESSRWLLFGTCFNWFQTSVKHVYILGHWKVMPKTYFYYRHDTRDNQTILSLVRPVLHIADFKLRDRENTAKISDGKCDSVRK